MLNFILHYIFKFILVFAIIIFLVIGLLIIYTCYIVSTKKSYYDALEELEREEKENEELNSK